MTTKTPKDLIRLLSGFLVLMSTIWATGCASAQEVSERCEVRIQLDENINGPCFIAGIFGKENYVTDSAKAVNGLITVSREEPFPAGMYYVLLPDKKKYVQLLLDKDQEFSMTSTVQNTVNDMQVDGSLDNSLYYQNLQFEAEHKKALKALKKQIEATTNPTAKAELEQQKEALIGRREAHVQQFEDEYPNTFFTRFKVSGKNPPVRQFFNSDGTENKTKQVYHYRKEFWDGFYFEDESMLRTPVFHNKLSRYLSKLTPQNGDSLVKYADFITRKTMHNKELFKYTANYIALEYKEAKIMDWEKVYVHMVDNFFTQELAFWSDSVQAWRLQEQIKTMRPSLMGMRGKNLSCTNLNGEKTALYDLKAPITVLFIYTTECDHCREQTPKLKAMYEQWKDKGVDVYALCIDQDVEAWKKFVAEFGLSWHNVIDPKMESRYGSKYHVDHTPEMYVLDENHTIVGKNLKAPQLPTIFERILSKQE